MKTIKMDPKQKQEKETKKELQVIMLDNNKLFKLIEKDDSWLITFQNAIISQEPFETAEEAEEFVKNNLYELIPYITFIIVEGMMKIIYKLDVPKIDESNN